MRIYTRLINSPSERRNKGLDIREDIENVTDTEVISRTASVSGGLHGRIVCHVLVVVVVVAAASPAPVIDSAIVVVDAGKVGVGVEFDKDDDEVAAVAVDDAEDDDDVEVDVDVDDVDEEDAVCLLTVADDDEGWDDKDVVMDDEEVGSVAVTGMLGDQKQAASNASLKKILISTRLQFAPKFDPIINKSLYDD